MRIFTDWSTFFRAEIWREMTNGKLFNGGKWVIVRGHRRYRV